MSKEKGPRHIIPARELSKIVDTGCRSDRGATATRRSFGRGVLALLSLPVPVPAARSKPAIGNMAAGPVFVERIGHDLKISSGDASWTLRRSWFDPSAKFDVHASTEAVSIVVDAGSLSGTRLAEGMTFSFRTPNGGVCEISIASPGLREGSLPFRAWAEGAAIRLVPDPGIDVAKLLLPSSCEASGMSIASVHIDLNLKLTVAGASPFDVLTPWTTARATGFSCEPLAGASIAFKGGGGGATINIALSGDAPLNLRLQDGLEFTALTSGSLKVGFEVLALEGSRSAAMFVQAIDDAHFHQIRVGRQASNSQMIVAAQRPMLVASLDHAEFSLAADVADGGSLLTGGGSWSIDVADSDRRVLVSTREGRISEFRAPSMSLAACVAPPDALGLLSGRPDSLLRLDIALEGRAADSTRTFHLSRDWDLRPTFGSYLQFELHRSSDLLDMKAHLINLKIDRGLFGVGGPRLEIADTTKPAVISFELPSQHIGEESELVTPDCVNPLPRGRRRQPRRAVHARSSFVTFRIPPSVLPMRLNLDNLLRWQDFDCSVAPAVRPETAIAPVDGLASTVLNFYRLTWIPALRRDRYRAQLAFKQSQTPRKKDPWHPIWHVRIEDRGLDRFPEQTGGAFFAAAWSPDFNRKLNPFFTSLSGEDRDQLVRLTHHDDFCPEPVFASHALLSAKGAWLKFEKYWPWAPARATISLEKYDHILAGGRDCKVQVQRRGFLFPFGHRAALIALTVRVPRWSERPDGMRTFDAPLETRYFIRITTPTVQLGRGPDGGPADPEMPFRDLTIEVESTPTIDATLGTNNNVVFPVPVPKQGSGDWGRFAFWPTICSDAFKFPIVATDWVGAKVRFVRQLVWVEDIDPSCCKPGDQVCLATAAGFDLQKVLADTGLDFGVRFGGGRSDFGSQRTAMGRSNAPGDTQMDLESVRFGATIQIVPCEGAPCAVNPNRVAHFRGRIVDYVATIPSLKTLSPSGGDKGIFATRDADSLDNRAELFAVVVDGTPSLRAGFNRDQSSAAGIGAPNPDIRSVSRRLGPTGPETQTRQIRALNGVRTSDFDPKSFFSDDANIFGVIPLKEIISLISLDDDGNAPSFLQVTKDFRDAADVTSVSLDWSTNEFAPWPQGQDNPIFVPNSDTQLELHVRGESMGFALEPPTLRVDGQIRKFEIRLGADFLGDFNGFGVIFDSVQFVSIDGSKPDVTVNIRDVQLLGAAMKFVQELREKLPFLGGGDSKFSIDVSASGVVINAPKIDIPEIPLGPATVSNLAIYSSCSIPFQGGVPLTFTFRFAKPDSRFRIVAGIYAGGGYASLELDANGVRSLAICLEFGVARPLRFGPVSGEAYCFCGFVYSSTGSGKGAGVSYVAYVRAGGNFTAWGFFSFSLEIYVGLSAYPGRVMQGIARCRVSTKVAFVSYSYTISYAQRFAGGEAPARVQELKDASNAASPPLADPDHLLPESISFDDWVEFEAAFHHRRPQ